MVPLPAQHTGDTPEDAQGLNSPGGGGTAMFSLSQPKVSRIRVTVSFAVASFSVMNMVGRPPGSTGFTIRALPMQEKALTRDASGFAACSFSINDSLRSVKNRNTPS